MGKRTAVQVWLVAVCCFVGAQVWAESSQSPAIAGSLGTCHAGTLRGAVALPRRAPGLRRLSVVGRRHTQFGTAHLVALVLRTAKTLRGSGAPLRVGNMSTSQGGRIRWSHSHQSGRDVDFPLFLLDHRGRSISPDSFVSLDDAGLGRWRRRTVRFDAERTWALVATLLSAPKVGVARLYLAEPLIRQVLQVGRRIGSPALVQRAVLVMTEPLHAGRHDDHLHLRIFCSRQEVGSGCVDEVTKWPWLPQFVDDRERFVQQQLAKLADPRDDNRAAALERLAPWMAQSPAACEGVVWTAAHDQSRPVRDSAGHALMRLQPACARLRLLNAAAGAPSDAARLVLLAVHSTPSADVGALLTLIGQRVLPMSLRQRSLITAAVVRRQREQLTGSATLAALPKVLSSLGDASVTTRRAALRTLEQFANRSFQTGPRARQFFTAHQRLGRKSWLKAGFQLSGLGHHPTAEALVGALRSPLVFVARNAEASLVALAGGHRPHYVATQDLRHRAWHRWLQLHPTISAAVVTRADPSSIRIPAQRLDGPIGAENLTLNRGVNRPIARQGIAPKEVVLAAREVGDDAARRLHNGVTGR
ncbi:MAG: penicillin-insensitive murein endopeptidase [Myxococcales bacterium]|nr:penicillin-insensitive murein endopeptidase [Myxococcales bacterium]